MATSADTAPDPPIPWDPDVVAIEGRFTAASNTTLLGSTADGERVIYKPTAGERPLGDFPTGTLSVREVLTYEVARAMDLDVVPETAMGNGPYGRGAVQRFVDGDESFDPVDAVQAADPELWPVAVLDVVCNNADRKLGHLMRDRRSRRLVAVDHGLTFHGDDKLRTVLWTLAGRPVPTDLVEALATLRTALHGPLGSRIASSLTTTEAAALVERVEGLLITPRHPNPPRDRPVIPWPPY